MAPCASCGLDFGTGKRRTQSGRAGDTLVDFGRGLEINDWLWGGVTREDVAERLRPLLERSVEVVLPAHGAPTDRAALARSPSV